MTVDFDCKHKLQRFLQWLQVNGAELRCCTIKSCGPSKGFGVYTSCSPAEDGVAMVVPLDLSINPMRVLEDPFIGPKCRAMLEEGDVDDRLLVILFLTVERLRPNSLWKPYLDMLPTTFGSPLWFTEDGLAELKGTTLYRASILQRKTLQAMYNDKVKVFVDELLHDNESAREVQFEDFLWAYSIFWTRALNIPFPRSYVFSESLEDQSKSPVCHADYCGAPETEMFSETFHINNNERHQDNIFLFDNETSAVSSNSGEIVWVEGLIPGIDFCNHGLNPAATWEVDKMGSVAGIPFSMYLLLAVPGGTGIDKEIYISYGNKGNEELLYLYGFIIDKNPSDFLMVHYPLELLQKVSLFESKEKFLELQKAELRCLLPRSLLDNGFFSESHKDESIQHNSFSWSGLRKVPSYLRKLVFPQEFMAALRTITMQDHELKKATSLLKEVVGLEDMGKASEDDVRAAVWESCGDYAALELLVDLLRVKMMELEESTGTAENDSKLLHDSYNSELEEDLSGNNFPEGKCMAGNRRSCVVYRRGQKQLTSMFLREAEHALELCASERP